MIKPASINNSLIKAVKHTCSNDTKFMLIEYIQRSNGKHSSDSMAKEIGLNEAKQMRKRLPVGESRHRRPSERAPSKDDAKKLEKKIKAPEKVVDELPKVASAKKSPMKSPIKKEVVPEPEVKKPQVAANDAKKPAPKGKKK